ncbi:pyrroline-5-carboxylate reductase [Opitutus sp. ER46]|uniref:pyrroline-5-carboxylate reductase n=1 Tax=Opitutus sp. ER46 TaxID=2161864 RepID=UPI000D319C31|nr:pyrroline-5-carboxylate reductase [Opitutus sp. ER46]PTX92628.1 pyrroline-5-carboxylate reductase [Opitutus sp. ER46]
MPKIAFLGAGNMASAFVDGLLGRRAAQAAELMCYGGADATAATLAGRTGIGHATSIEQLLEGADTVVVAFKPQHLASADPRLAQLTAGKLVISILAGKKLATLAHTFPAARHLVRVMPNTPGQIGAGMSAWCSHQPLPASDRAMVEKILGALGKFVAVEETQMDAITAVSGSGPAYVFEFAAALRDAAVAAGLAPDVAHTLAIQTVLGSAQLLAQKSIEPEILRNQVTSPNGTTYAGLQRMAARDFRGMMRETVAAAKARSEELSRE